mmetsp:Transcript_41312/g.105044  ORF Transcript_41312/g.105044 Transcript_41312/m.105044 type:complete len:230 (-) Transcript_41312:26-715(-)
MPLSSRKGGTRAALPAALGSSAIGGGFRAGLAAALGEPAGGRGGVAAIAATADGAKPEQSHVKKSSLWVLVATNSHLWGTRSWISCLMASTLGPGSFSTVMLRMHTERQGMDCKISNSAPSMSSDMYSTTLGTLPSKPSMVTAGTSTWEHPRRSVVSRLISSETPECPLTPAPSSQFVKVTLPLAGMTGTKALATISQLRKCQSRPSRIKGSTQTPFQPKASNKRVLDI